MDLLLYLKRRKHIKKGHPFAKSTKIDVLRSEKHPHTDKHYVFTVNVMRCDDCGLIWLDSGLESRTGLY